MPFVIAGLGDLAYALILFCIAAAIGTLTLELRRLVPDVSILGYHPFGFLDGALSDVHKWAVNTSDSAILRLRNLVVDVAHIDKRIVQAVISALTHVSGNIAHLFNVVIPDAQNAAQGFAQDLANTEHSFAQGISNTLHGDLSNTDTSLTNLWNYTQGAFHQALEGDIAGAAATALAGAEAFAKDGLDNLTQAVNGELSSVWSAIQPLQVAVSSTIPAEIIAQSQQEQSDIAATRQQDAANLAATAQSLQAELQNTQESLNTQITNNALAAAALSQADLTTAEGVAQADAAQARLVATQDAATALQATATDLQGKIDTNSAAIVSLNQTQAITLPSLPDISIPQSITVPLAVGALATAVAGVITEFDRCAVTACDGPNNYANLLQTLMGGADLAAILAFISEAARDPKGEAQSFAGVASGIYNDGHSLIDDLLSL